MPSRCLHPRVRRWAPAAVLLALLASTACESAAPGTAPPAVEAAHPTGPLCDQLPAGSEPGGPVQLATEPADAALKWIPVLTVFEAATRATGLDKELHDAEGVTILAPTDSAFAAALSASTLDELLLKRHDELRALLDAHILDGELSLEQMAAAGEVTTRSGDRIEVTRADAGMIRLADRADTVCTDYDIDNARIHLINGVLGELPDPAATEEPHIG